MFASNVILHLFKLWVGRANNHFLPDKTVVNLASIANYRNIYPGVHISFSSRNGEKERFGIRFLIRCYLSLWTPYANHEDSFSRKVKRVAQYMESKTFREWQEKKRKETIKTYKHKKHAVKRPSVEFGIWQVDGVQ